MLIVDLWLLNIMDSDNKMSGIGNLSGKTPVMRDKNPSYQIMKYDYFDPMVKLFGMVMFDMFIGGTLG